VLPIIAAFEAMFVSFEMDFTKYFPAGQISEDNLAFIAHLSLGRPLQTHRPYLSDVKAVRNS
jgi:hypothetical protein